MGEKERCRPPLTTLFIYLTQRCNLLCRHCYINPTHSTTIGQTENEIDVALLLDFIDQAIPLGLCSVKLSGGEPFLRQQDVLSICCHAKERGVRTTIETNGTLITEELADALAQAGVNFISVSLDGATAKTHEAVRGVQGCYESAVRAIEILASRGIHVQVITVINKRNIHEYLDILELGRSRGANSFKLSLMCEVGRAKFIAQHEKISDEEYLRFLDDALDNFELDYCTFGNHPMAFQTLGKLFKGGCGTCAILNLLSVLADGRISICGMGEYSEKLCLGTVGSSSLEELWETHPILRDLRIKLPDGLEGVCSMCVFKSICIGYCRVEAFLQSQSFTAPWSFCQRAFDSGVFPETRLLEEPKVYIR